jgi:hypothetical protein
VAAAQAPVDLVHGPVALEPAVQDPKERGDRFVGPNECVCLEHGAGQTARDGEGRARPALDLPTADDRLRHGRAGSAKHRHDRVLTRVGDGILGIRGDPEHLRLVAVTDQPGVAGQPDADARQLGVLGSQRHENRSCDELVMRHGYSRWKVFPGTTA